MTDDYVRKGCYIPLGRRVSEIMEQMGLEQTG